jgi:hypothetical protein
MSLPLALAMFFLYVLILCFLFLDAMLKVHTYMVAGQGRCVHGQAHDKSN